MQKERNIIASNLVSIILFEMDQFASNGLIQSSQIIIEGYITKTASVNGSGFTFTDKSRKNSIKCLVTHKPTIDESFQYPITITKYLFDHIVTLSSSNNNELQSNVVLIIETYSMPPNGVESGQFVMKPPKNINSEEIIQQKSQEALEVSIKTLLNEYYYKASSSNTQQVNFPTGILPPQRNESVFQIACELFNVQQEKGLLLQSRRGIEYPLDYFYSKEETSLEYLKSLNWEELIGRSSTLTDKTKQGLSLFQPSEIDINVLKGNHFEREKKRFLSSKTHRDTTTTEEKMSYPNKITNLINSYGDLQANLGLATICKYVLYKKYLGLGEKEKEKEKIK